MNDLLRTITGFAATFAAFTVETAESVAVAFSALATGLFALACLADKLGYLPKRKATATNAQKETQP